MYLWIEFYFDQVKMDTVIYGRKVRKETLSVMYRRGKRKGQSFWKKEELSGLDIITK